MNKSGGKQVFTWAVERRVDMDAMIGWMRKSSFGSGIVTTATA